MLTDEFRTEKCYKLKILTTLHYTWESDHDGSNKRVIKATCSICDGLVSGFKCNGLREDGSPCLAIEVR